MRSRCCRKLWHRTPGGSAGCSAAELLASLNHPNIAAVYGLERANGVSALVMELVEGPTRADRLRLGHMLLLQTGTPGGPVCVPARR